MEEGWEAILILKKNLNNFRSLRLKQLLSLNKNAINDDDVYYEDQDDQSTFECVLPDIMGALQEFKSFVKWEGDIPIPQKGLAATYDAIQ